jgi:hypothetical protein
VDQHADNHGAIRLNLHAVVLVGEQVFAAEHLLERAEEHLDQPPPPMHLRDGFRRQVEHDAAMLSSAQLALACSDCQRVSLQILCRTGLGAETAPDTIHQTCEAVSQFLRIAFRHSWE